MDKDNMFKDFMFESFLVVDKAHSIGAEIADWDVELVQVLICMIMEGWCRDHEYNVIDMSEAINRAVYDVNRMLGPSNK